MAEPVSFISVANVQRLFKLLSRVRGERRNELARIGDVFGDPLLLSRFYVEPECQHHNPADRHEDQEPVSQVRAPAFKVINEFLRGDFTPLGDGRTQMFILSDAGMGKTSLLMMIRLTHLMAFWPRGYDCLLLKLGEDTLERIADHKDKANTVLLLDALDEDPLAWGAIESRLIALLDATAKFRRVIISCRTQFFPETGSDAFGRPGRVEVGGYTCPMMFLSLFSEDQVEVYLRKRFPDRWHEQLLGRDNPERRRALRLVGSMRSLRFRPLLLAHVRDRLADGSFSPQMQLIPPGRFAMGTPDKDAFADNEKPQHQVTLSQPFALGRYLVTFEEYDRFCDATGRKPPPPDQGWGRGSRPVINATWKDAVAYSDWLSEQTGNRYRLPTEAEWEYATRAGTDTRWSFGDDEAALSEYAWYEDNSDRQTHPVGEKKPNPWGLHDVHGNVWEWVADCWHDDYKEAPEDGSPWLEDNGGDCDPRVIRGGSWNNKPRYLRSANRNRNNTDNRNNNQGFRLAQSARAAIGRARSRSVQGQVGCGARVSMSPFPGLAGRGAPNSMPGMADGGAGRLRPKVPPVT